jgi:NAD(P)-dependent dehydrogenase (short-subunit alcohol dehydrogenase family)
MMYGHLLDQTPQDWSLMMNVNLISVSYLTQLASKLMLENPKESSNEIIFINSMAGHVVNDNAMATMYNCTKFALTTLSDRKLEKRGKKPGFDKFSFLSKILTEQM